MSRSIAVVTLLTEHKVYCLKELLGALGRLERPKGYGVRYLVAVAGELSVEAETALAEFETSTGGVEVLRGPAIGEYDEHLYRCSMVAGELRERARLALVQRKDSWVLWVDADVLPAPDTLARLLSHGRALVSGLVLLRGAGHPICGIDRGDPEDGFVTGGDHVLRPGAQDVGWVGFGLFLVRGDLAREIGFRPYLDGEAPVWAGEDGYWCLEAARQCGERIVLDAGVSPWHVNDAGDLGIALRAEWTPEGSMVRAVRLLGETGPHRICLVPRVDGYSHRLGELHAGRPHWTDVTGRELSEWEMRELAASSRNVDLAETE